MPSMALNFSNSLRPYNNPPVPDVIIPASVSSATLEEVVGILIILIALSSSNNVYFAACCVLFCCFMLFVFRTQLFLIPCFQTLAPKHQLLKR